VDDVNRTTRPVQGEDLVDFRCSPSWQDYYFSQALTTRSSGRTPRFPSVQEIAKAFREQSAQAATSANEELVSLRAQIHAMGQELTALRADTAKLAQELQRRNSVRPAARDEMAYRGIDPDVIAEN